MTETQYVKQFTRSYFSWWLIALVLGVIVAFVVAARLKPSYQAALTLTINKSQPLSQNNASFYLYDGYYASQASVQLRNNIAAWVKSPRTVYDAYVKASLDVPKGTAESLARRFVVGDNQTTNTLDVFVNGSTKTNAGQLAQSLGHLAKDVYKDDVTVSDPVTTEVSPPRLILGAGLVIVTLALGFFASLIHYYFRP